MTVKVDNTAIQAGYPLYHHTILITEKGQWAVVQQGVETEQLADTACCPKMSKTS
jgi:hypothetical protein